MPTLLLRFPAGRYHATPFGHHVNEGLVEWPPSPWRLLRALVACGYSTQGWKDVPPEARRLLDALAATPPSYRLPPATLAHSRHYMPLGVIEKGREKTTLVFDTWADVGDGALAVRWNCEVDDEVRALFARLAAHLGYLGRSESWVIAESISDDALLPPGSDAFIHVDGQQQGRGWQQLSTLAPEPPEQFQSWREQMVARALEPFAIPAGKKKLSKAEEKKRAAAEAPYPADLIACLQKDTSWWKGHGWSRPPGSQKVLYWRRADALSVGTPSARAKPRRASVSMMLLALTTPSGNMSALPALSRTLPQAELLHKALVSKVGGATPVDCPEIVGKDASGAPLAGHQHAHLLPLDLAGKNRLDHILIHAPSGLGPQAQDAIRKLKRTWTKGGDGDLQVAIAGQGELADLRGLPAHLQGSITRLLGPPGGSAFWTSATPLVLPRHLKRNGKNTVAGQIGAELASRGLPPAAVELLPWTDQTRWFRHAVRTRRHPAAPPPVDAAMAVHLIFEQPVMGPVSLGYGSHFGLGLFAATDT